MLFLTSCQSIENEKELSIALHKQHNLPTNAVV